MALPFLHKFRTSFGRNNPVAQPSREAICHWPLSLLGERGPQMLKFDVMGIGDAAPRKAGIFIYAARRAGEWRVLYVGESADLSTRLAFNEIAADALLSGATDIHILKTNIDAKERRDIADRLILTNAPPLNEEERIKLAALSGEEKTTPAPAKGKIRAA
jgi:hypothetical protein